MLEYNLLKEYDSPERYAEDYSTPVHELVRRSTFRRDILGGISVVERLYPNMKITGYDHCISWYGVELTADDESQLESALEVFTGRAGLPDRVHGSNRTRRDKLVEKILNTYGKGTKIPWGRANLGRPVVDI